METKKYLGIWMDHLHATLIDMDTKNIKYSITSKFTFNTKVKTLNKSENLMHNKENQMRQSYYNEIAKVILKYDSVLLFGPTDAKKELQHFLNKDLHFKDIKIDIKSTDKMAENEKVAFVKAHFSHSIKSKLISS